MARDWRALALDQNSTETPGGQLHSRRRPSVTLVGQPGHSPRRTSAGAAPRVVGAAAVGWMEEMVRPNSESVTIVTSAHTAPPPLLLLKFFSPMAASIATPGRTMVPRLASAAVVQGEQATSQPGSKFFSLVRGSFVVKFFSRRSSGRARRPGEAAGGGRGGGRGGCGVVGARGRGGAGGRRMRG